MFLDGACNSNRNGSSCVCFFFKKGIKLILCLYRVFEEIVTNYEDVVKIFTNRKKNYIFFHTNDRADRSINQ